MESNSGYLLKYFLLYLNVSIWHNLSSRSSIQLIAKNIEIIGKGGSVEETLMYNSQSFLNQTTLDLRKEKWCFLYRKLTVFWLKRFFHRTTFISITFL
jgi:hypothetical protein